MSIISEIRGRVTLLLSGDGLKARTLRGSIWTIGGHGAGQFLRIAGNLLMTRILAPEIFGLMALATVMLTGLQLMSDVGIRDAVVRGRDSENPDFLATAWTIQVLRGLLLAALAAAIAWPVSVLYEQPVLFPMLLVMALSTAFGGFQSIGIAVQGRKLALHRVVMLNLATQVISLTVTVLLAWWLRNVWALAVGMVLATVVQVTLSYVIVPRAPQRFLLDRVFARQILSFGKWILIATALTFFTRQGVYTIEGLLIPLHILAFITIAGNLADAAASVFQQIAGNVGLPSVAVIVRERPGELRSVIRRIKRLVDPLAAIVLITLAFAAQPLIDILYDDRYADVGLYLGLLALNAGFVAPAYAYQAALLSRGESRQHAAMVGVAAIGGVGFLLIGFELAGPVGMVAGVGLGQLCGFAISFWFAWRRGYAAPDIDAPVFGALILCYGFLLWRALETATTTAAAVTSGA